MFTVELISVAHFEGVRTKQFETMEDAFVQFTKLHKRAERMSTKQREGVYIALLATGYDEWYDEPLMTYEGSEGDLKLSLTHNSTWYI